MGQENHQEETIRTSEDQGNDVAYKDSEANDTHRC